MVRAWVNGQLRAPGTSVTTVDFLFHAVKKLQLLARLKHRARVMLRSIRRS